MGLSRLIRERVQVKFNWIESCNCSINVPWLLASKVKIILHDKEVCKTEKEIAADCIHCFRTFLSYIVLAMHRSLYLVTLALCLLALLLQETTSE